MVSFSLLHHVIRFGAAYAFLAPQRRSSAAAVSSVAHPVHMTLTLEHLKHEYNCDMENGGRIILVGDVHGCADELSLLLDKIGFRSGGGDLVILLGDIVNKGPKSVEAVRVARNAKALALRGNHDDAAISANYFRRKKGGALLASTPTPPPHLSELGASVSDDYLARWGWVDNLTPDEVAWLASLPYSITLPFAVGKKHPGGVLLVHAGVVPGKAIEQQSLRDLTHMRNLATMREECAQATPSSTTPAKATLGDARESSFLALEKDLPGSVAWASVWRGPRHIYFGHDAKRQLQQEAFATGLDTGCLYGRELTAAVLPAGDIVSVPALATYVEPPERVDMGYKKK
mmetsp:Transcript_75479/g.151731  ORF Transcript_75479/g.151731 Transcript_75479/m.151731 type:complete len:345 (+) Transcript_75479:75-1109(+)